MPFLVLDNSIILGCILDAGSGVLSCMTYSQRPNQCGRPLSVQLHGYEAVAVIGGCLVAMEQTTKQCDDTNQLEVDELVQSKWTEQGLRLRAGALRSAH